MSMKPRLRTCPSSRRFAPGFTRRRVTMSYGVFSAPLPRSWLGWLRRSRPESARSRRPRSCRPMKSAYGSSIMWRALPLRWPPATAPSSSGSTTCTGPTRERSRCFTTYAGSFATRRCSFSGPIARRTWTAAALSRVHSSTGTANESSPVFSCNDSLSRKRGRCWRPCSERRAFRAISSTPSMRKPEAMRSSSRKS